MRDPLQLRRRSRAARERSVELAADARRRLASPPRAGAASPRGRLWLNGRELGDGGRRFTQLGGTYD